MAGSTVGPMRDALLVLVLVLVACSSPDALSQTATSSPAPSAVAPLTPARATVDPLAGAVAFEIFLPAALRADLPVTASLRSSPDRQDLRAGIGEPVLWLEVSAVPGGKPALYLYEGPDACCPDFGAPRASRTVTVRTTPEVRGELFAASSGGEGPTLRYIETSTDGTRTTIVMTGWSFGPYATEDALIELARSMEGIGRPPPTSAVLVYYSTHVSHSPTGHRISIGVRSGPAPRAARLIDATGRQISTAVFESPKSYDCMRAATAVAAMPVNEAETKEIARGLLRVEVERSAGLWVRTQLVSSNCSSME